MKKVISFFNFLVLGFFLSTIFLFLGDLFGFSLGINLSLLWRILAGFLVLALIVNIKNFKEFLGSVTLSSKFLLLSTINIFLFILFLLFYPIFRFGSPFIWEDRITNFKAVKKLEISLNKPLKQTFQAKSNNLGTIGLRIISEDITSKEEKSKEEKKDEEVAFTGADKILFRIKEDRKEVKDYFYENIYELNQDWQNGYFLFGFPVQKDSKDKNYLLEIEKIEEGETGKRFLVEINSEGKFNFYPRYAYSLTFLKRDWESILLNISRKTNQFLEEKNNQINIIAIFLLIEIFIISFLKKEGNYFKEKIIPVFVYGFLFCLLLIIISFLNFKFIDTTFLKKVIDFLSTYRLTILLVVFSFGFYIFYFNGEKSEKQFEEKNSNQKSVFSCIAKFKNKGWFLLTCIFLLGFIIRLLCSIYGNIDADEGIHLYDAKLLNEGYLPFRDYLTREPYYIFSLSLFIRLFGQTLFASRLLSVISSSIAIFPIYFLGKNLFSKKIGILSAAIFSLSPYIIYNTYLGNLYGVYTLITAFFLLSLYYMWVRLTTATAIISGFIVGLAVHFYRLTVFYFPLIGFIWGFYILSTRRKTIPYLWFILSLLGAFSPPLIFFSIKAGFQNFNIMYGVIQQSIAFASIFLTTLLGIFISRFFKKYTTRKQTIIFIALCILLAASFYSFFRIGISYTYKAKIIFDIFLQSYHFLFLIIVFYFVFLKKEFFSSAKLFFLFKLICLLLLFLLVLYGMFNRQNLQIWGTRILSSKYKDSYFTLFLLSLTIFHITDRSLKFYTNYFRIHIKPFLILFFSPALFYLIHVQLNVGNLISFVVLGSIFAAVAFLIFFKELSQSKRLVLIAILVFLFFLPCLIYAEVPLRDRMFSQKARVELSRYLKDNSKEEEEVFTNIALVSVVELKRRAALDLSRSSIYALFPVEIPNYIGVSRNLISSSELAHYIEKNINLILVDSRTEKIFETNLDFKAIKDKYFLDKKWDNYEIEAWKKI